MDKKIPKDVLIVAILTIGVIELVALFNGYDGVILTTIVGIIAALAGATIPLDKLIK